jgi:hypothetical protein
MWGSVRSLTGKGQPDSLSEGLVALPNRPEAAENGEEGECPAEHAIH